MYLRYDRQSLLIARVEAVYFVGDKRQVMQTHSFTILEYQPEKFPPSESQLSNTFQEA